MSRRIAFSYCFIQYSERPAYSLSGMSVLTQDAIADSVILVIKSALSPMLERLSALEARLDPLRDVRDRLVAIETKAAIPLPIPTEVIPIEPVDLSPVLERLAAAEARLSILGDLRDRMVTVETKSAQPVVIPAPVELPEPVDLSPVLERVASVEARLSVLGDLRDRMVVMETKSAMPVVIPPTIEPVKAVDFSPFLERIAAAEAVLSTMGDLRDRVVVVETKTSQRLVMQPLEPPQVDLGDVPARLSAAELKLEFKAQTVDAIVVTLRENAKDISEIRERMAVVEARPKALAVKGDQGDPGKPGKDGENGADGLGWDDLAVSQVDERTFTVKCMKGLQVKELGTLTFPVEIYRGVYIEGKSYDRGDGVTWGGSEWHCNETTTMKPGDGSKAWTLKVKRGRDGRDGKDAMMAPVVSIGKR